MIYGGDGANSTKAYILLESVLVLLYRSSHANMERNFALSGLTSAHAEKDMKAMFQTILDNLLVDDSSPPELWKSPNTYKAKRRSNYVIPDALIQGAATIEKEGAKGQRGAAGEGGGEDEQEGEGREEGDEAPEPEMELDIDDLSTDGL